MFDINALEARTKTEEVVNAEHTRVIKSLNEQIQRAIGNGKFSTYLGGFFQDIVTKRVVEHFETLKYKVTIKGLEENRYADSEQLGPRHHKICLAWDPQSLTGN